MNDLDQVNVDLPYDLAMGDEAGRIEFYKSAQAILKSHLQAIEDHKNLWFRTLSVETERDQLKAENERLRKLPTCWAEVLEQSEANDQLLDQVLELSAYAERYRYLRAKGLALEGHDFISFDEIADYRIDVAMGKGGK
jgi:hypothetical protein